MALRYTNTEKYSDSWFIDLEPNEKLLFYYLIDQVDNAGFYEISFRHIQFHLGISKPEILGAIKGLSRGLLGADSDIENGSKIYLKNYLQHQKMNPLNPFNSFHKHALSVLCENYEFVNANSFLSDFRVVGIKKNKSGEIIKKVDQPLKKYVDENQALSRGLVKVEVEVEVEVEGKEGDCQGGEQIELSENIDEVIQEKTREVEKEIRNNHTQINSLIRKIKTRLNTQTQHEEILGYLDCFFDHVGSQSKWGQSISELTAYFGNWTYKQFEIKNNGNRNNNGKKQSARVDLGRALGKAGAGA